MVICHSINETETPVMTILLMVSDARIKMHTKFNSYGHTALNMLNNMYSQLDDNTVITLSIGRVMQGLKRL